MNLKKMVIVFFITVALTVFVQNMKSGVTYLRLHDFANTEIGNVQGNFGFYNEKFISSKKKFEKVRFFIECPKHCSDAKFSNGNKLSRFGYGTYTLKLLLSKNGNRNGDET